jgi:Ca-activated chloride channel family protein
MEKYVDIAFWHYSFYDENMLWGLLIIPMLLGIFIYQHFSNSGELKVSTPAKVLKESTSSFSKIVPWFFKGFFLVGLSLVILALAKPFQPDDAEDYKEQFSQGIDIVLAMDISASMLARDFHPNRVEAAKKVAAEFIENRPHDRIGLVAYEGEAFTACPSTTDHAILLSALEKLQAGMLGTNGTAIGSGLGLSVERLRSDKLKSKVIILMSDGVSNVGEIDPMTAAKLAKAKNVRVYSIGIGTIGMAPMPVMTPFGVRYQNVPVDVDEKTLKEIAEYTGGTYFRATDEKALRSIYKTIDEMEKTKVKVLEYKVDPPLRLVPFLLVGGILIMLSWLMQRVLFRRLY